MQLNIAGDKIPSALPSSVYVGEGFRHQNASLMKSFPYCHVYTQGVSLPSLK